MNLVLVSFTSSKQTRNIQQLHHFIGKGWRTQQKWTNPTTQQKWTNFCKAWNMLDPNKGTHFFDPRGQLDTLSASRKSDRTSEKEDGWGGVCWSQGKITIFGPINLENAGKPINQLGKNTHSWDKDMENWTCSTINHKWFDNFPLIWMMRISMYITDYQMVTIDPSNGGFDVRPLESTCVSKNKLSIH